MELVNSAFNGLYMAEEGNGIGRMGRRRHKDGESAGYKSKNLFAERRRRQKLSDRLLELRALVPIITNMNKATIIVDAIAYIQELQSCVIDISEQLHKMEAIIEEESKTESDGTDAAEEMKKWGIETEVAVTHIDDSKLWMKIVFEKKRGGFTKLMEAISVLGFEFTNTSVTTSKGAILISSCLETKGSTSFDTMPPMSATIAEPPASGLIDAMVLSPAPPEGMPEVRRIARHHSSDKSVAGGDVILGGFATAVVASIYCYIRITRRNKNPNAEV
ncbi:hypothetical protein F0562_014155 [Nyssa sinensis]|uniref:BHLH domain-containing protein n=1 Tax=Nyssa sinensis TaxID=561372 RepID=A0A5J4ZMR0_9ASTE|nr:hypothetical protein F0562_014155 [Nyssa sinensis]